MERQSKSLGTDPTVPPAEGDRRDAILAVGLGSEQQDSLPSLIFGSLGRTAVMTSFADLTRDRLWSAIAVLSPLVALDFDAVDLAGHLASEEFKGRYFVVTSNVPDPSVIRAEVAAAAPGLDVEVIDITRSLSVVPKDGLRGT